MLHVELAATEPLATPADLLVLTVAEDGASEDALVAAADAALYKAKRAGKNRTVKAE